MDVQRGPAEHDQRHATVQSRHHGSGEPPSWASGNAADVEPAGTVVADRRSGSFAAALPSALAFLAGVWLVLAPFVLHYANTGDDRPGYWNDVVVGAAIAIIALARATTPIQLPWLSVVNIGLGAYLITAPLVVEYNAGPNAPTAVANDVIVGIIVILLAGWSALAASWSRTRDQPRIRTRNRHQTAVPPDVMTAEEQR